MKNSSANYEAFLMALNKLSDYFCDPMSEARQDTYWEALRDKITLDEWAYVCTQVIDRATFHKVPLVAELMEYVTEYRKAQWEAHKQQELNRQAQRLIDTPRPAQATPGEIHQEVQALLTHLSEAVAFPAPRIEERAPEYRTPLAPEAYADRKARLLAQARQIEENRHGQ